ncbi:unnamed protein product [Polarella glacialis]|uniref:Serine aminopeptidase S33 domain-containing protein n=1 Tax=Polarella glacialis TaxID=89957 RepID=A0A813HDC7_POLGL|nr:unnamed protein product [Polarella glacialis]
MPQKLETMALSCSAAEDESEDSEDSGECESQDDHESNKREVEDVIGIPMPKGKVDLTNYTLPPTTHFFTFEAGCKRLHVRNTLPAYPHLVQGSIFFVHGYGAHINRPMLNQWLQRLAAAGYAIFSVDFPGHGYSPGERAYVENFEEFLSAYMEFVHLVRTTSTSKGSTFDFGVANEGLLQAARQKPFFIMGESMGGLLALVTSQRIRKDSTLAASFRGTVLMAPALKVDLPPDAVVYLIRHAVVPLMPSSIMPAFLSKSASVPVSAIIRDEKLAEKVTQDNWGEAKGGIGWRNGMRWVTANAFTLLMANLPEVMSSAEGPMLVLHDPQDLICHFGGSERLMELSPSTDKTLIKMEDARHDIASNEPDTSAAHITEWLAKHGA